MGIGDISPYTPPRLPDGERGPRHWRPEPERLALLIHDMQRYFLRPFSTTESPYREMLDNLVAVRARCAEWGVPVFYTAQPGSMTDEQRGLLKDFWGPGMAARAEDREIVAELAPGDGDVVPLPARPAPHRPGRAAGGARRSTGSPTPGRAGTRPR